MRSDTTPAGVRDLPAIWNATSQRIVALLGGLSEDAGDITVPTVPGATVRDVVAHLADRAKSSARNPLVPPAAGQGAGEFTLTESLAAWGESAAGVHTRVEDDPQFASFLITDAVLCEHDLLTTLGAADARDDIAIKVALDELSGRFSDRVEAADLPPLRVTVEQWGTIAGRGHANSCVVADRFEFVRAMSGRRSAAEIRRWNWGVEPDPYLPVMSEVGLPPHEIRERDPRIPEHMRDREFVL